MTSRAIIRLVHEPDSAFRACIPEPVMKGCVVGGLLSHSTSGWLAGEDSNLHHAPVNSRADYLLSYLPVDLLLTYGAAGSLGFEYITPAILLGHGYIHVKALL